MIVKIYKKENLEQGGEIPEYPQVLRNGKHSNTELEDGETILTEGKLFKVSGKTHAEGGEDMLLSGGSKIYSEYTKAPQQVTELVLGKKTSKKYSYADLSKKFPTQKSMNILKNPDSDQYETNTAEITLNKNQAMLDTIFSAQEMEKQMKQKSKGKIYAQSGTLVPPTPLTYFQEPFAYNTLQGQPFPINAIPFQNYNILTGEQEYTLPEVVITDKYNTPTVSTPTITPKPVGRKTKSNSKPKAVSQPTQVQSPGDNFVTSVPLPFSTLPQAGTNSVQSINSRNPFEQEVVDTQVSEDTENYPGFVKSRGKSKFGINPKLAGTIMDIGLALSDNLDVEAPILFNNKTYPIFNRFVKFDNKEPGRNLALSVQQIQNSNMPEQVKQAQIAQLTAQANEQQSQVDFGNQQRYEQKQERDVNKLQQYMDRNTMVGNQDLENYLQRKGRVESLKNEFKARRKSNIVNSIRGYADYADTLNLQNQIYADNYRVNPITGKVDFTGSKQDPLKQQEQLMAQYQTNAQNTVTLQNGVTMTSLGNGNMIVIDADGKAQIIKTNQ